MCTLTIAYRVFPGASLVVAANRDERVGRPSEPPTAIDGEPPIVAPRDGEAGGTWIGFNGRGVFAGLSNRPTDDAIAAERSRGQLVMDALGAADAESAARAVEDALAEASYDGFNLVVADQRTAILFEWDGRLHVTDLAPGLHVVLNAGYDDHFVETAARPGFADEQREVARRVRVALQPGPDGSPEAWLDRAAAVLGDHDIGVCVHGEGYGTRSSSLIALFDEGRTIHRFADGPPCRSAFEDVEAEI